MATLVIAEHDNASLRGSTHHSVTAAAQCGSGVHILVAGHHCDTVAAQAARIAGVTLLLVADAVPFADGLAENVAAQVLALSAGYSHILAPATAYGKNIAPRVAALLDVGQISEITKVDAPDTFERPIYAGNAIATVRSADAIKVITVRTTGFNPAAATSEPAPIERVNAVSDFGRSRLVGCELTCRPARRRHGRIARRGRRRLCAKRLASRPDRENRRTGLLHCSRNFGCDPAPGRNERLENDRRDQQGSGGADFLGGGLRHCR